MSVNMKSGTRIATAQRIKSIGHSSVRRKNNGKTAGKKTGRTRIDQTLQIFMACQKVIMRAKSRTELAQSLCREIVEAGGYAMAWVGLARNDAAQSIHILGKAGNVDGFLDSVKPTWKGSKTIRCPGAQAIIQGQSQVINNILLHPERIPWRGEALKRGFSSVAAFPFLSSGKPFGVLVVYGLKSDLFVPQELELLELLTESIVYGLMTFHTRSERIKAESEVKNSLVKLRKALGAIIQTLEQTVEIRDPYTAGHQRRVADLARMIGDTMGLSADTIDGIRFAGIIHDVGKIYIPAEILSKPRPLTTLEFNLIKSHPQVGYDVLKAIDFPWPVPKIILQHHERINGSGYPNQLKGKDILIEAKILGVADVVEAMASHRPYRPALGISKALDEIFTQRGILYETEVVNACLRVFREQNYSFKEVSFTI